MKKWFCALLCLCLMLPLCPAQAEDVYAIMPLQSRESRVKLRKHPSTQSEILGQYYAGTELTVLSAEGGWAHVDIAGRTGYMMDSFLQPLTSQDGEVYLPLGDMALDGASTRLCVYERPDPAAAAQAVMPQSISVLGTVGDDWLHVLVDPDNVSTFTGFVSSDAITQWDWMETTVSSGSADGMVNFRSAPSRSAPVLGKLFSGTPAQVLFDDHVADDGWQKVRIGHQIGYIMDNFLDTASPPAFLPPMTEITGTSVPTYAQANQSGDLPPLGPYDPFYVLGVFGDLYYVRIETWLTETEYGARYAFVPMNSMQRQVTRSAEATGTVIKDTQIYWLDDQGRMQVDPACAEAWLRPGMTVTIFGRIQPDAQYILVTGVAENSVGLSGYIPANALQFDDAMVLPAAFTVG